MSKTQLANALRKKAEELRDTDADAFELVRVLARIVDGKPVSAAFGSPGYWGYGTPIGDALAAFMDEDEHGNIQ